MSLPINYQQKPTATNKKSRASCARADTSEMVLAVSDVCPETQVYAGYKRHV
ncbi:MAG: hypothetical protein WA102_00125 [Candidatus Methanoperedens sp.]